MSRAILHVQLLTALSVLRVTQAYIGAVVLAPNTFRIGVEETIFMQLSGLSEDTDVLISLLYEPLLTTLTLNAIGKQLLKDLNNYMSGILPASNVTALMKATARGLVFFKSPAINVVLNTGLVFIQLDKPIYAPGQEVNLQIIVTDNLLIASREPFILEFTTPKKIIVYQEKYEGFQASGVLKINYPLSMEPDLGLWTATVRTGYQFFTSINATFEVKEYVLPTFNAWIELIQRYILADTGMIEGKVTARYAFEEPVHGSVKLLVMVLPPGDREEVKVCDEIYGKLVNGEINFNLDLEELRSTTPSQLLRSWYPGIIGSRLKLVAYITESRTYSRKIASNDSILFIKSPYVISFENSLPDFKPGYSYSVKVTVRQPNGDPSVGVPIAVTDIAMGTSEKQPLPPAQVTDNHGSAIFTIPVPFQTAELWVTIVTNDAKYTEQMNAKKVLRVYPHQPVTGSEVGYVWLQPRDAVVDVHIGSIFTVDASVHNPHGLPVSVYYLVVSHGRAISWGRPTVDDNNAFLYVMNVDVKPEMVPFFRIIVYAIQGYNGQKGYLLADALQIHVENKLPCNNNTELRLSLKNNNYAPKNPGILKILGEKDSYVGLIAVDQVIHPKDGFFLTRSKVFQKWAKTDVGYGPGGGRTVGDVLKNAGLVALFPGDEMIDYPEATLKNVRHKRDIENEIEDPSEEDEFFAKPTANDIRSNFPETWLYEDFQIGDAKCPMTKDGQSCELSIPALPDRITEWNFHAFAMSPVSGICVAEPMKVSVEKSLFTLLKLPYVAVHSQIVELVATVFNFGDESQKVLLSVTGVDGLLGVAKQGEQGKIHYLTVPPGGTAHHRFSVTPIRTGEFNISVTVRSIFGADVLIKPLKVVAKGIRQSVSSSELLDPSRKMEVRTKWTDVLNKVEDFGKILIKNPEDKEARVSWYASVPAKAILGTARATLAITGTILENTLETSVEGVEGFFQDATGGHAELCLMQIAPTLYGALYLKYTGQLTIDAGDKVKKHLAQGYTFSLQYRKVNGGFSVYAQDNYLPMIWLTSCYMRMFCKMRQFVPEVQNSIINSDLQWIGSQQKSNGMFDGTSVFLYQTDMTGGLQGSDTMTAFTLIAFGTCVDQTPNEVVIPKAQDYLEGRLEDIKTYPYVLAMVTYALALTNSSMASKFNEHLQNLAKEDTRGNRYWTYSDAEMEALSSGKPWVYTNAPHALSVEITAYALLAQVTLNEIKYAGPIVAWLAKERSAKATFVQTQDIAVTLEALAAYGKKALEITKSKTKVDVFINDGLLNVQPLIFDRNSKNLIKELEIPLENQVRVEAKGDIPVLATFQIKYKSPGHSDENDAFSIKSEVRDVDQDAQASDERTPNGLIREVYTCIEYKLKKKSGMVLAQFGIPAGYTVEKNQIKQLLDNRALKIGNVELENSSVVLYFDEIVPSPRQVCFPICLIKTNESQNLYPTKIEVFSYYDKDEMGTHFYEIQPAIAQPLNNQCQNEICSCQKGSCPIILDESVYSTFLNPLCSKEKYSYVVWVKSKVKSIHEEEVTGQVIQVISAVPEKERDVLFRERQFFLPLGCDKLKVNSYYLIIGQRTEIVKSIDGKNRIRYIIDKSAQMWEFPSRFLSGISEESALHYIVQRLKSAECSTQASRSICKKLGNKQQNEGI